MQTRGNVNQRPEFSVPFDQFRDMPAQMGYVGLQVLAPIPVDKQSGTYYVQTLKEQLKDGSFERSPSGHFHRRRPVLEEITYRTREFGQEQVLDDRLTAKFMDKIAADAWANDQLWRANMREIERHLVAKITDTTALADTAGTNWSTQNAGTPISDIIGRKLAIHAATGLEPDTVVIGYAAFHRALLTEEFKDTVKFSGRDDPKIGYWLSRVNAFADACGLRRVLVAGAVHDTADQGQPVQVSTLWPTGIVGVYCTASSNDPISEACVGRTPTWDGDGSAIGGGETPALKIESYRAEDIKADVFRILSELDTESDLAYPAAGSLVTGVLG
jgi:hypothetical protein